MNIKTHDIPLLTAGDDGWIIFRDFETLGRVFVESQTQNAVVEVASATIMDPTLLGSATTLTFTQAGVMQTVALPAGTTDKTFRCTRVRVTSGRVSVTFLSTVPCAVVVQAPTVTTFGI